MEKHKPHTEGQNRCIWLNKRLWVGKHNKKTEEHAPKLKGASCYLNKLKKKGQPGSIKKDRMEKGKDWKAERQ